jgi:hypothetical protein
MTEPGTDEDPGPAWLREALRIRGNRGPHLSVPYQEQVIAIAHTYAWTYEEALNYVVGVGLGILVATAEAHKAIDAEVAKEPPGHLDQAELQVLEELEDDDDGIPPQGKPGHP